GHGVLQLRDEGLLIGGVVAGAQDRERHDALSGGGVARADHGGLGDGGVGDECGFDLGGGDAVAGDVHDVVDSAEDPQGVVGVDAGAVAGEVPALFAVAVPVGFAVAVHVAPDAAQHRRPWLVEYQVAVGVGGFGVEWVGVVVDDLGADAGQGCHGGAGFGVGGAGQGGDHDGAGFGLPPGVDDGGAVFAEGVAVPAPGVGVDGFADGAEQAQGGQVVAVGGLGAPFPEGSEGGGGGGVDGDAVFCDDVEVAVFGGGVGGAFVDDLGGAVGEGAVDDVGVAGDPADVGGAPVDVVAGFVVEDVVVGVGGLGEVAAAGVQDAFGFSGGAGGVEDEQGVFGGEGLGSVFGGGVGDGVVPPQVTALGHGGVDAGAGHHEDVFDGVARFGERLVDGGFQRGGGAAAELA